MVSAAGTDDYEFQTDDFARLLDGNVYTIDPEPEMKAGRLAESWKLETLEDAYSHVEPTRFLVDGLLPTPSLAIIYGGPGSLKSMLLADMAMCIASGKRWLEPLPNSDGSPVTFSCNQAKVLWVDFDNGRRRTRERIGAIGRGHELPADTTFRYVSMPTPWLDASDNSIIVELAKLIQANKFELIVIDNLGLITGDVEENSGGMATVMGHLRWLSEECEAAVVIVHHQRKSNGGADGGIRKGETLRGHSTIEASLDLALLIERHNRDDHITIMATKVRDYQQYDLFGAHWTYEHYEETKMLWAGRFYGRAAYTGEEAVNVAIKVLIKQELRMKSYSGKDLVERVRDSMAAKPGGKAPGINKVRGLIREMVDNGELLEEGSTKDKKYRLT
jgi:hypothetical protein